MKQLNDLLKLYVLPVIQAGLVDADYNLYALIKPVLKGQETNHIEYDDPGKLCQGIHPNDKKDLWVAMMCTQIQTSVLSDIGKKKRYLATAKVDLIGYSKTFRLASDYVASRLSEVPYLTITNISDDSYKALAMLSNAKNYNVQHDMFIISFDYVYKTDFCTVETLTGTGACANVY